MNDKEEASHMKCWEMNILGKENSRYNDPKAGEAWHV